MSLNEESQTASTDDLSDVWDLLEVEFMESCRGRAGHAASLEEVRKILSAFTGSLSDRISEERDGR